MKVKTSITLDEELLSKIDALTGAPRKRSSFIEDALEEAVRQRLKAERDARDIAIYEKYADVLNEFALDTLGDQAELPDDFDEPEERWP
jgi:metal-responsive CopG/Arc/MetJ family transcriptional regulator